MTAGLISFGMTQICTDHSDDDTASIKAALARVPQIIFSAVAARFAEKWRRFGRNHLFTDPAAANNGAAILSDPLQFLPPGISIEFGTSPEGIPTPTLPETEVPANGNTRDTDVRIIHESTSEAYAQLSGKVVTMDEAERKARR